MLMFACSGSSVHVRVFDPFRVSSTHARLFGFVCSLCSCRSGSCVRGKASHTLTHTSHTHCSRCGLTNSLASHRLTHTSPAHTLTVRVAVSRAHHQASNEILFLFFKLIKMVVQVWRVFRRFRRRLVGEQMRRASRVESRA